jgi:PAS domain S-box-containing protein/excisionase family DNA binding protein
MVSILRSPHPDSGASAPAAEERSHYSISQAAALLGVSRMSIWRWVRAGRLPVARLGHRTVRIRREDLDWLLAEHGSAGSRLRGVPDGATGLRTQDGVDGQRTRRSTWRDLGPSEHVVQVYEADAALLEAVGEYIGAGLRAGEAAIAIATEAHRTGLEERLRADGLDLDSARASGQYIALDAAETLARIMADGEPEPDRFAEVVGAVVARATTGGRPVRAFGEMVALLATEGNHAAAIRLESLWNGLQRVHTFSLFCAYPMDALGGEAFAAVFSDVCTEHTLVIPTERYTALETADARLREIALLQQRAASLEVEIAERERFEMAALRLAAIVESSDDAIIGKTLDGIIVDWNRGAERLYGYSAAEAIGRPISLLIPEDLPDELPVIIERLSRGERIDHYDTERISKDGRRISVSLTISPIRNAAGRLVGASAIARDISERRCAEREREELLARERQARAEAEAALRLRDEFLSIASHELRTPLAVLKGHAQVALRRLQRAGQLEPVRAVDALRAIESQSDKLNRLVGRLLDIPRIETGKLELERRPTDIVALVEQVVSSARARETGHAIVLAASPSLEAEVDPLRLEQVLTNLLDNAIKYSPEGGTIEVVVSRSADEAPEIAVRDHGLGIPPEKRAQIFERFFQAHGNGHKRGLGLGLYISRQIVELHGGEITAESPADGGSRFVVRLPVIREMARPARP